MKSTPQKVRRNLSDISFERLVLFGPNARLQTQLSHKTSYFFVIDFVAAAPDRGRYPPIPVAALVLCEKDTDALLQRGALIPCLHHLLMVVESAAWQSGHLEKLRKRVTLP